MLLGMATNVQQEGRDMTDETYTVTEMQAILDNAQKVCAGLDVEPSMTPWYVGLVSTERPSEAVLERGRRLAQEHGW